MKKILKQLDELLLTLSALCFLSILIVNVIEIFKRSILGSSLLWHVDFSIIMVCWMLCLGMASAIHRREHLVVDFVVLRFSPSVQRILQIMVTIAAIIFFIAVLRYGLLSAETKMHMKYTTIGWKMGVSYYSLPVFAMFAAIFSLEKLVDIIKGVKADE